MAAINIATIIGAIMLCSNNIGILLLSKDTTILVRKYDNRLLVKL